jgi:hypothetical protein
MASAVSCLKFRIDTEKKDDGREEEKRSRRGESGRGIE